MFARSPFDIFDDLLARAFTCSSCLSHVPLLSGYDEPTTLSYQIQLFGPRSPDVRHISNLEVPTVHEEIVRFDVSWILLRASQQQASVVTSQAEVIYFVYPPINPLSIA
jgi:hypothetical protein